jgi:hypothetical protein
MWRSAKLLTGRKEMLAPYRDWVVFGQRFIVRIKLWVLLVPFHPAAWLDVFEGLADEARPVTDRADEIAIVDEVEGVGIEGPVAFSVIDFEAAIGRDPVACYWLVVIRFRTVEQQPYHVG